MNRPSMRILVGILQNWASSCDAVSTVYVAGSQVKKLTSDEPIEHSDVDLVVWLRPDHVSGSVIKSLSEIGVTNGILIHPLVIEYADAPFKTGIPHYKQMIDAAVMIYDRR